MAVVNLDKLVHFTGLINMSPQRPSLVEFEIIQSVGLYLYFSFLFVLVMEDLSRLYGNRAVEVGLSFSGW